MRSHVHVASLLECLVLLLSVHDRGLVVAAAQERVLPGKSIWLSATLVFVRAGKQAMPGPTKLMSSQTCRLQCFTLPQDIHNYAFAKCC